MRSAHPSPRPVLPAEATPLPALLTDPKCTHFPPSGPSTLSPRWSLEAAGVRRMLPPHPSGAGNGGRGTSKTASSTQARRGLSSQRPGPQTTLLLSAASHCVLSRLPAPQSPRGRESLTRQLCPRPSRGDARCHQDILAPGPRACQSRGAGAGVSGCPSASIQRGRGGGVGKCPGSPPPPEEA